MFSENLARIRTRIQQACQRSGRDPSSVTLVCVTKGISVEMVRRVIALGVIDVGENRVQEAHAKQAASLRPQASGSVLQPAACSLQPVRWHLVGHLQRNKAKDAVDLFDVIHSLDSVALAEELDHQAGKRDRKLTVFLQVNVSGETTKFGCRSEEAASLAQAIGRLPHLRLVGLMAMAPFVENPEQARPYFRQLRLLRDAIHQELVHSSLVTRHSSLHLSMGMSQDFEVAIEEGADVVRIGTAIFKGA